jgi:O-Antigen ligase
MADTGASRRAVAASMPVAFLLVASRWGSHIGAGPVYVTDVLLALAFANAMVGASVAGSLLGRTTTPSAPPKQVMLVLLVAYCVLRFLVGGHFNSVALRDSAPYLYSAVGLLSGATVAQASAAARARTVRIMWAALYLHAAWCALAVVKPGITAHMPSFDGLHVFSLRLDFDGAVLGVLGGLAFIRWGQGRGFGYLVVVGGTGFVTASMGGRAGLLAFVAAIIFGVVALWRGEASAKSRWRLALVPVAGALVAVILPTTFAGARLIATFGDTSAEARFQGQHFASASGTTMARKKAWNDLASWITASGSRTVVGVGFGPDFLAESGANVDLLGEAAAAHNTTVRSPHEYLLGSWARLGVLGLVPLMAVCLGALRRAWRFWPDQDELELFTSMTVTTLFLTALVGVVLESPFGAVPFFWSAGILAADSRRRRQERQAPATAGQSSGHAVPTSG